MKKTEDTIGQRICATVLSHQLGISTERAMKLYVVGHKIAPEWETVGEALLGRLEISGSGSCGEQVSGFRSGNGKFLSLVRLAGGSYLSHFSACQAARSKGKRRRSAPGQWRLF